MIAIGAGQTELDAKLDEYNGNPKEQREVFFHVAVDVPPRQIECFYQHVGEDAKLSVSWMVMKGAGDDHSIVMKMWDPHGEEMAKKTGTSGEVVQDFDGRDDNVYGAYKMCFYNTDKIFERLVDINVQLTNVNWLEYKEALPEDILEDLDKTHFAESFNRLHTLFRVVALQVEVIKRRMFADFLTVKSNLTYVDRLGMLSCMVIIGSGVMQVYFVRRMFETPNVRGTTNKT
ncbi:Hypp5595 [Branchiostoma lanceolatum]|uniref:Hypp5595 protein n=1 Tax=Branchiostoma lanceolatum TaxID=7740 RepID=A0A8J9YLK1_BRALA|nr:Hypp5595 [Branchiostoma lanceolatum]